MIWTGLGLLALQTALLGMHKDSEFMARKGELIPIGTRCLVLSDFADKKSVLLVLRTP